MTRLLDLGFVDIKDLSSMTKCSRSFIRSCIHQHQVLSSIPKLVTKSHENERKAQFIKAKTMDNDDPYYNSRVIKVDYEKIYGRKSIGRHLICKQLKKTGRHWSKNIDKMEKKHTDRKYGSTRIEETAINVFKAVAESLALKNPQVLFLDESEFQTRVFSKKRWKLKGEPNKERDVMKEEKLHVIACCSTDSMIAIQVYESPIKMVDTVYFLTELFKHLKLTREEKIRIVADNASWHTGWLVADCGYKAVLTLNQPAKPMFNMIESLFSKCKSLFASRKTTRTRTEELGHILNCFKSISRLDTAGYLRALLRTYLSVLRRITSD